MLECSSDDSDYEPAPIGKPLPSSSPPPIPPPRSMTLSHSTLSPAECKQSSLFHTMRKSISLDLRVIQPQGTVQISEFITQHSALLPCKVRLTADDPSPLRTEGQLNLHFIKHTKVVVMTHSSSGDVMPVPLNSAAKFSVLYNPDNNLEQAVNGYNFESVRDVIARKPLPIIIRANRCYHGSSVLCSVSEGEVLCVRGTKTSLRSKQLRVQNMKGQMKHLNERCTGHFTTAPAQISLPISSLLDLGIQFPATAVFSEDLEDFSGGSVLVMERIAGETCLIASDSSWRDGQLQYMEVSSDLRSEVEVVQLDFHSRQELLDMTHTLFHSFFSVRQVVDEAEQSLRGQVLSGREQEGVQLVLPITIDALAFQNAPQPEDITVEPGPELLVTNYEGSDEESEDECEQIYAMPKSQVSNERVFSQPMSHETMTLWSDTGIRNSRDSDSSLSEITAVLRNLETKVEELSSVHTQQLSSILYEIQGLKSLVGDIRSDLEHHSQPEDDEMYRENRRIISNMDCNQV